MGRLSGEKSTYVSRAALDNKMAHDERETAQKLEEEWTAVEAYKAEHQDWPTVTHEVLGRFMVSMGGIWKNNRGSIPQALYLRMRKAGFPPDTNYGRGNAGKGKFMDVMLEQARNKTLSDEDLRKLKRRYNHAQLSDKTADVLARLGYDVRPKEK